MADVPDHPPIGSDAIDSADSRKRKRGLPRAAHACDSCRKRKSKCDQERPCSSCVKHAFECTYRPKAGRSRSETGDHNSSFVHGVLLAARPHKDVQLAPNQSQKGHGVNQSSSLVRITSASILPRSGQSFSSTNHGEHDRSRLASKLEAGLAPAGNPQPSTLNAEQSTDSLRGVNSHTQGHEFYGPMGAFSFLSRLRFKALSEADSNSPAPSSRRRSSRNLEDISIVNLLHSSDYPVAAENSTQLRQPTTARVQSPALKSGQPRYEATSGTFTNAFEWYKALPQALEVEKECIKLYFQNLHNIHPILEPPVFLSRCEQEIWSISSSGKSSYEIRRRASSKFLALYNAVMAIGAITAGEQSSLVWQHAVDFLSAAENVCGMRSNTSTYPPLRLARLFIEKSKSLLGDIFDSCSFETAQTLFLMSVFCQNALKPHSCYMYSGIAARAALAIGVPNRTGANSGPAATLWWALYSHEIEMCASAGRESALGEPGRYTISLPRGPTSDSGRDMIACMVSLAQLLNDLYRDIYLSEDEEHLPAKSSRAHDLDIQLNQWRATLPAALNLSATSLKEPEQVTKQKIVLRLRFFNARILLHRPFLIASSSPNNRNKYGMHVELCVDASRKTIDLLYDAYMHRPYFRTWWYNCTYVLYASMILLYVVLTRLHVDPAEDLIRDAEKSLEIFKTMDMVAVAGKCAEITQEVLEIARQSISSRAINERKLPPLSTNGAERPNLPSPGANTGTINQDAIDLGQDDVYATLLDSNLLANFMEFDEHTAWYDNSAGTFAAGPPDDIGMGGININNFGILDHNF